MRLFIAIPVNELKNYLSQIDVPGRRVKEYHLTLKFLGEVDTPERVIEALKQVEFHAFDIRLADMGIFPNAPRVVWVGVEPIDNIIKLQQDIEKSLVPLGFPTDKRFHPHITISRLKKPIILEAQRVRQLKIHVDSFLLIRSTLTPKGPNYETVKTFINKA